jgi:hypothetical protein
MPRVVPALACAVFLAAGCDGRTVGDGVRGIRFEAVPAWMAGYCKKAAADLGYPVLCPSRLPRMVDIVPCRGPAPENELWGRYCSDYVLDSLFRGPPGYRGPFGANRRVGHLALWSIARTSGMFGGGLFGCPGGGRRIRSARLRGHSGTWWACPAGSAANLNSGHLAFQWVSDDVIYGLSVHGINAASRDVVRTLADHVDLVGPKS